MTNSEIKKGEKICLALDAQDVILLQEVLRQNRDSLERWIEVPRLRELSDTISKAYVAGITRTPEPTKAEHGLKEIIDAVVDSYTELPGEGNADHCRRIALTVFNRIGTPSVTKEKENTKDDIESIHRSYSIDARSEEFNALMNKLGYLKITKEQWQQSPAVYLTYQQAAMLFKPKNEITKEQLLEILPERKSIIPGNNCKCAAHGECECGCGADWTDYETWNKYHDTVKQRIEEMFK